MVNRGVALYEGKVFVAAYDGRLIALDAATGKLVWEKDTIIDHVQPYTITGAPRVFQGQGDHRQRRRRIRRARLHHRLRRRNRRPEWRWFTVPGDPTSRSRTSRWKAARPGTRRASGGKLGGGGTAWDTMAFDPELNLIYIGIGNGSPWSRKKRSPAGGDNLYLASIVALDPDTGKYVWHYQETPGDNWDYTSTQPMILADIEDRRQAAQGDPARAQERLLLCDRPHRRQVHLGQELRRRELGHRLRQERPPDRNSDRAHGDRPREIIPSAFGARNWHSMSFNPDTGLVYMPVQGVPLTLMDNKDWKFNGERPGEPHSNMGWNLANFANVEPPTSKPFGRLMAWDPVKQKAGWTEEQISPWNGGTLTTAGNLVFQGTADGRFVA